MLWLNTWQGQQEARDALHARFGDNATAVVSVACGSIYCLCNFSKTHKQLSTLGTPVPMPCGRQEVKAFRLVGLSTSRVRIRVMDRVRVRVRVRDRDRVRVRVRVSIRVRVVGLGMVRKT